MKDTCFFKPVLRCHSKFVLNSNFPARTLPSSYTSAGSSILNSIQKSIIGQVGGVDSEMGKKAAWYYGGWR